MFINCWKVGISRGRGWVVEGGKWALGSIERKYGAATGGSHDMPPSVKHSLTTVTPVECQSEMKKQQKVLILICYGTS